MENNLTNWFFNKLSEKRGIIDLETATKHNTKKTPSKTCKENVTFVIITCISYITFTDTVY